MCTFEVHYQPKIHGGGLCCLYTKLQHRRLNMYIRMLGTGLEEIILEYRRL